MRQPQISKRTSRHAVPFAVGWRKLLDMRQGMFNDSDGRPTHGVWQVISRTRSRNEQRIVEFAMRGRISHKSVISGRYMRLSTVSSMGQCKIEKGSHKRAQIPAPEDYDLASEKIVEDPVDKLTTLQ